MNLIDISPTISERLAVWPGDVPFSRDVALDFEKGDNLVLSAIKATVHLGAHADAPNHYHPDGVGISERDPALYIGPAQVICASTAADGRIYPDNLENQNITAPRVLLKTSSFPNPEDWNTDFAALSPELVRFLAGNGVCLVGIDTPSVDPFSDKVLHAHREIYAHDMAILEGLVLTDVQPDTYFLIAPPLKLKGLDASPVRALLLPLDQSPCPS